MSVLGWACGTSSLSRQDPNRDTKRLARPSLRRHSTHDPLPPDAGRPPARGRRLRAPRHHLRALSARSAASRRRCAAFGIGVPLWPLFGIPHTLLFKEAASIQCAVSFIASFDPRTGDVRRRGREPRRRGPYQRPLLVAREAQGRARVQGAQRSLPSPPRSPPSAIPSSNTSLARSLCVVISPSGVPLLLREAAESGVVREERGAPLLGAVVRGHTETAAVTGGGDSDGMRPPN